VEVGEEGNKERGTPNPLDPPALGGGRPPPCDNKEKKNCKGSRGLSALQEE